MNEISDKLVLFIDVRNAVLCPEDHVYDGRFSGQCPACTSDHRVHLEQFIGRMAEPQGSARPVVDPALVFAESEACRIFLAEAD